MRLRKNMTLPNETQWLRDFAAAYIPNDEAVEYNADDLRRSGISVVDLMCFFRGCHVNWSDKVETDHTIWRVTGEDCDGDSMSAELLVHTQEMTVKINRIVRVKPDLGPTNDAA